jgi:tetratricopeptide (TPR) repeat protein
LALYEENLKLTKDKLGPDHPDTLATTRYLATVCRDQGDYARAEALLLEVLAINKPKFGAHQPEVGNTLSSLGLTFLKQKKFVEAEPVLREALAISQQTSPNAWPYFDRQSQLGASLLGQQKNAEAEPLLLAGYEGLKKVEAKIPANLKTRLTEAVERLVQLYDATGQKAKADEWRAKLKAVTPEPKPGKEEKK